MLQVPSETTYYTTMFSKLKGADFSKDSSLVDIQHSPNLLNMISDEGAFPRKRKGWEILNSEQTAEINNIWTFDLYDKKRCVVAVGTKIIEYDLNTNKYVGTGVTTTASKKAAFFFANATSKGLYILNKTGYIFATATSATAPLTFGEPNYYIPLVVIARDPANGGGTIYEGVNLLSRMRQERFYDKAGTATTFLTTATVAGDLKFEYFDGSSWVQDTTATFDGCVVRITTAHEYKVAVGEDNIKITYRAETSSTDTSIQRICGCNSVGHMTQGVSDQVFLTANPDFPQHVCYCALADPTYFPDLNYLLIGSGSTEIMGFMNVQSNLAVVKESSSQDTTIYLLSSATVNETDAKGNVLATSLYKAEQGTTGVGAASKWCFKSLNDEPLMLSPEGVFGMVSTTITSEKVVRNRSRFLDRKLLAEPNLENAVAEIWNQYYILVINGHAYVLDGRQKTADDSGNTNYLYESYYWDNIPATCLCNEGNYLYFGTADGKICRFKNHTTDDKNYVYDYSDGSIGTYGNEGYVEGTAINARWGTPNYDDNAPQYLKTMNKRGSLLTMQPYERSGADVYYSADSNPRKYIGHVNVDIWKGFSEIDFSRFSFDTREGARDYFFGKKIKNYKRLQLIVENNTVNEPFGVHEIIRTYSRNKFARK